MPFIYVPRSRTTGRLYTGATLDLAQRLMRHNSDQSISTKHRGPWDLVHQEEFETLAEAVRRERDLKTDKGREELKKLLTAKSHGSGGQRSPRRPF